MRFAAIYARCPGIADVSLVLFVVGSVLFLPALGEGAYLAGVWLYLLGSLGFLSASLLEEWRASGVGQQSFSCGLFVLGSLASAPAAVTTLSSYPALGLFIAGCVGLLARLKQLTWCTLCPALGCTLFIAGCGLFLPPLGQYTAGAGLFIAASACFLLDALSAAARPILWGVPVT
jgi:hypothetical protein